jgi:hypothetical protein
MLSFKRPLCLEAEAGLVRAPRRYNVKQLARLWGGVTLSPVLSFCISEAMLGCGLSPPIRGCRFTGLPFLSSRPSERGASRSERVEGSTRSDVSENVRKKRNRFALIPRLRSRKNASSARDDRTGVLQKRKIDSPDRWSRKVHASTPNAEVQFMANAILSGFAILPKCIHIRLNLSIPIRAAISRVIYRYPGQVALASRRRAAGSTNKAESR